MFNIFCIKQIAILLRQPINIIEDIKNACTCERESPVALDGHCLAGWPLDLQREQTLSAKGILESDAN